MGTLFSNIGSLIGRMLLCLIFLFGGIGKLTNWSETQKQMADHGIPAATIALVMTVIIEIGGGLLLLFGYWTRLTALVLFAFLILVTLTFHGFWNFEGADRSAQTIQFLKNLAIEGGLLMIAAHGAGGFSLDGLRRYWISKLAN